MAWRRAATIVSVARNTMYNMGGAVCSITLALVTVPPYLHQIGDARYGVLALVWVLLGYFGLFDLGLSRATANHIARLQGAPKADREAVFWTAMALNTGLGVIGGLALYFVGGPVLLHWLRASPTIYAEAVISLPWIAAAVPVATSTAVMTGALTGQERFGVVNIVNISGSVLFQVVPLVAAFAVGPELNVVIPAAIISRCVLLVPLFFIVRYSLPARGRPRIDRAKARELLGYGAWVSVSNVVGPILATFDRFVIGAVLSASAVAYYDVPFRLAAKARVLPQALSKALFPRFSAQTSREAQAMSLSAAAAVNGFMTPLVVVGLLLMQPFLTLWVGADFSRHAAPVGTVLLLGTWINSVAYIPFAKLQGQGHPNWVAMAHMGEVLPYLAALWWALHQFGLVGAATVWAVRVAIDAMLLLGFAGLARKLLVPLVVSGCLICSAWWLVTVDADTIAVISAGIALTALSAAWGFGGNSLLRSRFGRAWGVIRARSECVTDDPLNCQRGTAQSEQNLMRNER